MELIEVKSTRRRGVDKELLLNLLGKKTQVVLEEDDNELKEFCPSFCMVGEDDYIGLSYLNGKVTIRRIWKNVNKPKGKKSGRVSSKKSKRGS
jgi:hypothetical protein